MTYDELKTRINDLPHTRYRAQIVNDLNLSAQKDGFEKLFDYIEYQIRAAIALSLKPKTNGIPAEVNRDGLRRHFGMTNGQISGATTAKKLQCRMVGRINIYPTSQPYLQNLLASRYSRNDDLLFKNIDE